MLVGWFLVAALVLAAFFLPLWTGNPIPYHYWHAHMWLRTWG
jgi:dolichyl-phosphate-mannose--protein O-mannosyl transferase